MKVYRLITIILLPLFLIHSWIYIAAPATVFASEEKVTTFSPESIESRPLEIPDAKPAGKPISKWWYALLLAAVGGAAAAAGGGGGGGGGDGGGNGGSSSGTSTVTW